MSDYTSAPIHHAHLQPAISADGTPILTTVPVTPSIDFNPSEFRRSDDGASGAAQAQSQLSQLQSASSGYSNNPFVGDHVSHSNPHPVVAKTGVDLSEGIARPAEPRSSADISGTTRDTAQSAAQNVSSNAQSAAQNVSANAQSAAQNASATVQSAAQNVSAGAQSAAQNVSAGAQSAAQNVSANAKSAAQTVSDNTPTVTGLRQRAGSITNQAAEKVNAVGNTVGAKVNAVGQNIGTQINHAAEHPAVQNAKHEATQQVNNFRQVLGRYPIIVNAEKRTGVDRVALVIGGVFFYLLLIPLNLFGLALPTTQLLTFLPPTFLALRTLDNPNEERTKTLLAYFVTFGFVQFAESLMAGFLERRIPQYYTVKLLFLAYLIHPRTKGARKVHEQVFRPLLARAQQAQKSSYSNTTTPPTTKPSSGTSSYASPTFPTTQAGTASDVPLTRTSGFSGTGPSSVGHAGAPVPVTTGPGFGPTQTEGFAVGNGATGGSIHLPSGGGNGIGQEVPRY